ncbi:VanW family protein [Enterocloster citroniae]|uniref:VanW family protein n=1 Tax=Enterocloster citroniae TaxID=358743 RepID=UPI0032C16B97
MISILLLSSVEKGRQENSGLGNVIAAETMEKNNQTADGGKAGTETAELTIDNISITGLSREQVERITSKWNRTPTNAQLTGRDKEKGSWIYSDGEKGIRIDQEEALQEIMGLIAEKDFTKTIAVQARETSPECSAGEIKEQYQVIGTFATTATSNQNRNNNISLAVSALDGLVIFPGEEFSFNETTGNRTKSPFPS